MTGDVSGGLPGIGLRTAIWTAQHRPSRHFNKAAVDLDRVLSLSLDQSRAPKLNRVAYGPGQLVEPDSRVATLTFRVVGSPRTRNRHRRMVVGDAPSQQAGRLLIPQHP